MRKIIDYKILKHELSDDLEKEVKEYLERGWELQGAMEFAYWVTYPQHRVTQSNFRCCQTMVKYSDDPFLDKTAVTDYLEQK